MSQDRWELLAAGVAHMEKWCELNGVEPPRVLPVEGTKPDFGVCAYYRSGWISIWPDACARPGLAGRAWSWPGYSTDRTPYGVIAHELCHHVEEAHGAAGGIVAAPWRAETGERPLTGYCPNDNEWLAEIFRLYVTNPDLLRLLRRRTFPLLKGRWPAHAETRSWEAVLAGSERHLRAARNKIAAAR